LNPRNHFTRIWEAINAHAARMDKFETRLEQIFGRETKTKQKRIKEALVKKYGRVRPDVGPTKAMEWLARQPGFEDLDESTFYRAWTRLGWSRDK
jgi:hypothetical protein